MLCQGHSHPQPSSCLLLGAASWSLYQQQSQELCGLPRRKWAGQQTCSGLGGCRGLIHLQGLSVAAGDTEKGSRSMVACTTLQTVRPWQCHQDERYNIITSPGTAEHHPAGITHPSLGAVPLPTPRRAVAVRAAMLCATLVPRPCLWQSLLTSTADPSKLCFQETMYLPWHSRSSGSLGTVVLQDSARLCQAGGSCHVAVRQGVCQEVNPNMASPA